MNDEFYMQLALEKAWQFQGLTYPNPAVGAVIIHKREIIAIEAHQKAGTSHAEVLALLVAYEHISYKTIDFSKFDAQKAHDFLRSLPKDFFSQCTIYVTLEPCSHVGQTPSCAGLLKSLNLAKIIIGTKDTIEGHGNGAEIVGRGVLAPTITVGVLEKECKALLEPFMIWQKRAFVLFKLAQTSNARIGGGYLSSKASLTHVHQLRVACDTLLIGGNTVRVDRPTLDCRFMEAKAPDVKIYAHPEMITEAKGGEGQVWLDLMESLTEGATSGTKATYPTSALKDQQEVKIDNITIKAHLNEFAHTKTDAMYQVMEDKVLVTGDNAFNNRMTRLDDGSYLGNIKAMDTALNLDIDVVVPGHGPSGGKEVLSNFREFLYIVYDTSKTLLDDDMEPFEMKPIIIEKLEKYQGWENFDGAIGKLISVAVLEAENE